MSAHRNLELSAIRDTHRSLSCIAAVPLPAKQLPRRSWLDRARQWLANARARRKLVRCHELDPRLARDIGLSRSDLLRESMAPFWEPVRRR